VKKTGKGAGVLFLIQMENAKAFKPNDKMDKLFADSLTLAKSKGVDIMAYDCLLGENFITLNNKIEILL